MKNMAKKRLILVCCCFLFFFVVSGGPSPVSAAKAESLGKSVKVNAFFNASKMGDMSDYDPGNPIIPTGDTIKIGMVMPFSGPAALIGQSWFTYFQWAAHDYNKRGGIWVDGKKKKIEIIRGDHMSKQDLVKKIAERMVLQDNVDILVGCESTPNTKILMEVGNRYKKIVHVAAAMSDDVMDARNFNRYSFQTVYQTGQFGRGLAYYYGQIRKKEKKFYILCQDYGYGRSVADGFKKGLKEYYPDAQIIGEDYHKLFLTDFAPYLTKIKASNADAIFTGDWYPDMFNLVKQARAYGIKIPIASKDMEDPTLLLQLGSVENTRNLFSITQYNTSNPMFKTAQQKKYHETWKRVAENWKTTPYNSKTFKYGEQLTGHVVMQAYWLLSVIERAKSTNAEEVIKIWENDRFGTVAGKVLTMRACDHRVVQDMAVIELVPPEEQKISYNIPPFYWYKDFCFTGPVGVIPAEKVFPFMDPNLDRCKGKNGWGE